CSAARSFGKKKKEVEARAGIEPACKDLQSLGMEYRWAPGEMQPVETLEHSGFVLLREHTGTFCVIPDVITHELQPRHARGVNRHPAGLAAWRILHFSRSGCGRKAAACLASPNR